MSNIAVKGKVFRLNVLCSDSNLQIVSMIPGDCKVAGCFNFSNDFRGVF